MKSVFTFGESMGLVQGAELNAFSELSTARISSGGSEGNVAIGLSRLGLDVTWFSRVGADSVGERVIKDLQGENVRVIVKQDENLKTGLMIKTTPRQGRTSVTYYRAGSAASFISPNDFQDIDFSKFNLVHLTGITPALSKTCLDAAIFVANHARAAGCMVSFDVNFRSKLWSRSEAGPVLRQLVARSNILIAGIEEAELVTEIRTSELGVLAGAVHELGPEMVVIKQGEAGATLFHNGKQTFAPAIKVDVVDTVGAGDAFSAAFLGTYLVHGDSNLALTKAVVAGGLACTHPGDWQGFPRLLELSTDSTNDPVTR